VIMTLLQPLFRLPRWQKRLLQLVADCLLITFSFLLSMLLRLDSLAFLTQPRVWWVLPVPRSVPFIYAMLALLTVGGVRFALRGIYLRN